MICRLVLYHALPNTDPMTWLKDHAADIRGVPGMRYVDFVQSLDDPTQWGAIMSFHTKAELEMYKSKGAYQHLVESLSQAFLDKSKPVTDLIFDLKDV